MKALWRGETIADSEHTIEVGGYRYFPRDAVRMEMLTVAPKTTSDHDCPHGVQFYDVVGGAGRADRAAWSYEKPRESMKQVDHWVGFWNEVQVV